MYLEFLDPTDRGSMNNHWTSAGVIVVTVASIVVALPRETSIDAVGYIGTAMVVSQQQVEACCRIAASSFEGLLA